MTHRLPTSAWSTLLQAELAELEQRQQQQDGAQRSADGGAAAEAGDADAGRQEGGAAAAGADSSDSEPDQVHLPIVCLMSGILPDRHSHVLSSAQRGSLYLRDHHLTACQRMDMGKHSPADADMPAGIARTSGWLNLTI